MFLPDEYHLKLHRDGVFTRLSVFTGGETVFFSQYELRDIVLDFETGADQRENIRLVITRVTTNLIKTTLEKLAQ